MEDNKNSLPNNNAETLRAMASETSSAAITSEYTIEERDTITTLEEKLGLSWQEIFVANKDIMQDPNVLQPGMKLKIPKKIPD
jgi:nucleoid-associated protein YgaU